MLSGEMQLRVSRGGASTGLLAPVLLLAVLLLGLVWLGPQSISAQQPLTVTASPESIQARGGKSTITVRISQEDAIKASQVSLRTELGAFNAASGPSAIVTDLKPIGGGILSASVDLVGDGRAGVAEVTASVGSFVGRVSVRVVGEVASIELEQPMQNTQLDAARQHQIRLTVTDERGVGVPNAPVNFSLSEAPEGATLRGVGPTLAREVSVTSSLIGSATAYLKSEAGRVVIDASSGDAVLQVTVELYGQPTRLSLVAIAGESIEVGEISQPGTIQALLTDERGGGVPDQRITFSSERGLVVAVDGSAESRVTDASGRAQVHLDATRARLGSATIQAAWSGARQTLIDELEIAVSGPPAALYLTAESYQLDVDELFIEPFERSSQYRVRAEVVDEYGQRVGGEYQVRWRARVSGSRAQVTPEVSVTEGGLATAVFQLEHVDGLALLDQTVAQAWLISKAQVNNRGTIGALLGEGVALRAGWNDLIWRGATLKASELIAPISTITSSVWQQSDEAGWQAWFSESVPGAVDFELISGDRFYLVLHSATIMEQVELQVSRTP